jgi:opacity protein-like surface antigen
MKRVLISFAVLALLFAGPASAVTKVLKTNHTGFYVGLGLGYGNLGINLKNSSVSLDREGSTAGMFFIGAALRPDLLLGLDAHGWTKENNGVTRSISTSTICLTYYPSPQFFVKGGVVVGSADVKVDYNFYSRDYSESGFGATLGAGMEFRMTKHFALLPSAQWSYQSFDDFTSNVFSLTFNIGWFW